MGGYFFFCFGFVFVELCCFGLPPVCVWFCLRRLYMSLKENIICAVPFSLMCGVFDFASNGLPSEARSFFFI